MIVLERWNFADERADGEHNGVGFVVMSSISVTQGNFFDGMTPPDIVSHQL